MEAVERDRGGTRTYSYTGDCTSCQHSKVRRMCIFFQKINKFRIGHFKRNGKTVWEVFSSFHWVFVTVKNPAFHMSPEIDYLKISKTRI